MAEVSLEAQVELLPTEAHGREGAIRSGYRPSLWLGETGLHGEPSLHSCVVRLLGRERLCPGEAVRAEVLPLAFGTWPPIRVGTRFDLIEGTRPVGSGRFESSMESIGKEDVRHALHQTLEEWVGERFGDLVVHRPVVGRSQPDLVATFRDQEGHNQTLVAEVVARRPWKRDVERIARVMDDLGAQLGLIIGLDDPSPAALETAYDFGRLELRPGRWLPRIRMLSTRDLHRWDPELIPGADEPERLELIES